jgi:putative selenium metabolism protein SsnA
MLLVGNGRLITREKSLPFLSDGCVAIKENLIYEVGATEELKNKYPGSRFIDAKGRVIMPGMINTHMHLYSTFARGMALKDAPPENFAQILERLWWRLDKVLDPEDIYYSALVPLIDCIKNGTTTIFDHHASPGSVRNSLFTLARAAKQAGVRSCLSYEVSDRDGHAIMAEGIRENAEFIAHINKGDDEMLRGMFGLHASLTLSDSTLEQCRQGNPDAGFHVHVAEGIEDLQDSLRKSGKRVVERLNAFGILSPKSIAAHCVHVDQAEIQILKDTAVNVVHNPESNMGNAVGCAPVLQMLQQGVRVGLGSDGYTCDMFESYKVANILHKHHHAHPSVAWGEAPTMLFENNPQIGSAHFPRTLGRLVHGAYADVIIVDYNPPTQMDENNTDGHILFGMSGRAVATTIINGKVVMEEHQLTTIDEEAICAKARELSQKVWERF